MDWILSYPIELQWAIMLLAGVVYGGLIGLIPSAGPGKAIILLFAIVQYFDFPGANYLFVLFSIATVVSCSIGDSFAGVLLGIPGAAGAAATMVDGFPLAQQGKASYALSAAIFTSTVNGLIFGVLGILALPYYERISSTLGVPEIFGLVILAFALISVMTTKNTFRSIIAILLGCFIGSIGISSMGFERHTLGLLYLEDGIPIVIVAAGLFAIPEIFDALRAKYEIVHINKAQHNQQTWDGIKDSIKYKWLALQGGLIGYITGLMPGTGGGVGDWSAYAATVAQNKNETIPFGKGNIKGVIGSEGANNSGKMGGLLPTIMFGIPGGKMYAIMMGLWMYVGFEVGDPAVMEDSAFITHLFGGYMLGTLIAGIVMLIFARHFTKIVYIKPIYWMVPMGLLTIWAVLASRYYVDWEIDLIVLLLFSILGYTMKHLKFSRPALLMAFVLFDRIETSWLQINGLYFNNNSFIYNAIWIDHWIMTICLLLAIMLLGYGFLNKNKIMEYT
jgi:TctA family transporter